VPTYHPTRLNEFRVDESTLANLSRYEGNQIGSIYLGDLHLKVPYTNYIHRGCLDHWEAFLWQAFSQPAKVEKKAPESALASTPVPAVQEDDGEEGKDDDTGAKSKTRRRKKERRSQRRRSLTRDALKVR